MAKRDSLLLVCTDRGQHASAQIAQIAWTPTRKGGAAVWTPGEADGPAEAITERARGTKRGGARHVQRRPVGVTIRAGGGSTFHLPKCQRCNKSMDIRDDRLEKLRDWPGESCDISLMRW